MKYDRLTKEQFEELYPEFVNFLASQSIDKSEWDKIKREKPDIAEQELDVFSDLIWEGVLQRARFLEHFSTNHIFLFHCLENHIESIVLKSMVSEVDFLTKEGLDWLSNNIFTDAVDMKIGSKEFSEERNLSIFSLIKQGAFLSDGKFYHQIHSIIKS